MLSKHKNQDKLKKSPHWTTPCEVTARSNENESTHCFQQLDKANVKHWQTMKPFAERPGHDRVDGEGRHGEATHTGHSL